MVGWLGRRDQLRLDAQGPDHDRVDSTLIGDDLRLVVVGAGGDRVSVFGLEIEEEYARPAKVQGALPQLLLDQHRAAHVTRRPPADLLRVLNIHRLAGLVDDLHDDAQVVALVDAEVLPGHAAHLHCLHVTRRRISRLACPRRQMDGRGSLGSSTTSSEITGSLYAIARLLLQPLVLGKEAAVELRLCAAFDVARGGWWLISQTGL